MRRVLACLLATGLLAASAGAAPALHGSAPKVRAKSAVTAPAKSISKGPAARQPARPYQVGRASWYGKKFHGRLTASGEAYDMFQFTAAHKQLPLGSWVKVTNLKNSKWVVVRVNDRGPYVGARVIDLSYGAAQMLDLRGSGTAKVRIDVVREPNMMAEARTSELGIE